MSTFTGSIAAILAGQKIQSVPIDTWHDALQALTDPWTSFTPTWGGTTTNPVLNNGSITASYLQDGKFVVFKGKITMGSSTTFGSGIWTVTVPVNAVDITAIGQGLAKDSSPTNGFPLIAEFRSVSQLQFWPNNASGQVTNAAPLTWASGDSLNWTIIYEAA